MVGCECGMFGQFKALLRKAFYCMTYSTIQHYLFTTIEQG